MKSIGTAALAFAGAIVLASCGGSGGGSTPTSPSTPSTGGNNGGTPASVTVSIMGDHGNNSFNPNPAPVNSGQVVMFKNTDTVTHHIVLDDGSMTTGDIAPGTTSAALPVGAANVGFHCTIHPDMVGAFNSGVEQSPPPSNGCSGAYCLGGGK
jgi:plastocyanin